MRTMMLLAALTVAGCSARAQTIDLDAGISAAFDGGFDLIGPWLSDPLPVFRCSGVGFTLGGQVYQCWRAKADGLHIRQESYRDGKFIADWQYTVQPAPR